MAADVGIAVKGVGVGTAVTASGTSQATGSTFYVFAIWDSFATFTSVADNKGNTSNYSLVGAEQAVGAFKARLYKCVNGAGGAGHTATVVVTGAAQPTVFLVEVTGVTTVSPVDQSDRRTDSASPYTLAAGLTTVQNNELLLTFLGADSGSNPATQAETGLGSSSIVVQETNGASNWTAAVAKSYKTSTGTFNPSWTESGATNSVVFLETLKEAVTTATLTSPTPSGTLGTSTTATLGASTDQVSGTGYGVVDTSGNISGVTAAQVKAGQNNTGAAAVAANNAAIGASPFSIGVTGLTQNTAYSYAVVQNNTNGDSNVVTGTFTTAVAASPNLSASLVARITRRIPG